MNIVLLIIAIVACLLSVATIIFMNLRQKKLYDNINDLIEAAMSDNHEETSFDESRQSALETKLSNFLSASSVSARNVREDRNKIKTLISDISHQTKTPIANLMLYSELLEEMELPNEAKEYVKSIHGQADKLKFLIEALVKMSRLENGILVLKPETSDVASMLSGIAKEYEPLAHAKGLKLTLDLGEPEAVAHFDEKWTKEAIGNIVDNAVKYTSDGGINISVSNTEMFLRIDISDSGIGIAETEQAQIFSRFYRAESVSSEPGIGIGLYLAREIIAAEGGYIKVTSSPGAGARFSIFLPVLQ